MPIIQSRHRLGLIGSGGISPAKVPQAVLLFDVDDTLLRGEEINRALLGAAKDLGFREVGIVTSFGFGRNGINILAGQQYGGSRHSVNQAVEKAGLKVKFTVISASYLLDRKQLGSYYQQVFGPIEQEASRIELSKLKSMIQDSSNVKWQQKADVEGHLLDVIDAIYELEHISIPKLSEELSGIVSKKQTLADEIRELEVAMESSSSSNSPASSPLRGPQFVGQSESPGRKQQRRLSRRFQNRQELLSSKKSELTRLEQSIATTTGFLRVQRQRLEKKKQSFKNKFDCTVSPAPSLLIKERKKYRGGKEQNLKHIADHHDSSVHFIMCDDKPEVINVVAALNEGEVSESHKGRFDAVQVNMRDGEQDQAYYRRHIIRGMPCQQLTAIPAFKKSRVVWKQAVTELLNSPELTNRFDIEKQRRILAGLALSVIAPNDATNLAMVALDITEAFKDAYSDEVKQQIIEAFERAFDQLMQSENNLEHMIEFIAALPAEGHGDNLDKGVIECFGKKAVEVFDAQKNSLESNGIFKRSQSQLVYSYLNYNNFAEWHAIFLLLSLINNPQEKSTYLKILELMPVILEKLQITVSDVVESVVARDLETDQHFFMVQLLEQLYEKMQKNWTLGERAKHQNLGKLVVAVRRSLSNIFYADFEPQIKRHHRIADELLANNSRILNLTHKFINNLSHYQGTDRNKKANSLLNHIYIGNLHPPQVLDAIHQYKESDRDNQFDNEFHVFFKLVMANQLSSLIVSEPTTFRDLSVSQYARVLGAECQGSELILRKAIIKSVADFTKKDPMAGLLLLIEIRRSKKGNGSYYQEIYAQVWESIINDIEEIDINNEGEKLLAAFQFIIQHSQYHNQLQLAFNEINLLALQFKHKDKINVEQLKQDFIYIAHLLALTHATPTCSSNASVPVQGDRLRFEEEEEEEEEEGKGKEEEEDDEAETASREERQQVINPCANGLMAVSKMMQGKYPQTEFPLQEEQQSQTEDPPDLTASSSSSSTPSLDSSLSLLKPSLLALILYASKAVEDHAFSVQDQGSFTLLMTQADSTMFIYVMERLQGLENQFSSQEVFDKLLANVYRGFVLRGPCFLAQTESGFGSDSKVEILSKIISQLQLPSAAQLVNTKSLYAACLALRAIEMPSDLDNLFKLARCLVDDPGISNKEDLFDIQRDCFEQSLASVDAKQEDKICQQMQDIIDGYLDTNVRRKEQQQLQTVLQEGQTILHEPMRSSAIKTDVLKAMMRRMQFVYDKSDQGNNRQLQQAGWRFNKAALLKFAEAILSCFTLIIPMTLLWYGSKDHHFANAVQQDVAKTVAPSAAA